MSKAMLKQIIFFSCLWEITYAAFTCDPYEDCTGNLAGGHVPDPYNCEKFYVCVYIGTDLVPSDSSVYCRDGYYFDSNGNCTNETFSGVCDFDYCATFATTICESACHENAEVVAYAGNCSYYYICNPGDPVLIKCPDATPYFDGQQCVADKNKCCNTCVPYCYSTGRQIADPYDCTMFYICSTKGTVQEQFHAKCPTGNYFEPVLGTCVAGTSCVAACS